jgi:hypothetical protein
VKAEFAIKTEPGRSPTAMPALNVGASDTSSRSVSSRFIPDVPAPLSADPLRASVSRPVRGRARRARGFGRAVTGRAPASMGLVRLGRAVSWAAVQDRLAAAVVRPVAADLCSDCGSLSSLPACHLRA